MRKLANVLGVVVVSGSLVSVSLADQKADVARVEQELRATAEAAAMHNRASHRARTAVEQSSLGRKLFLVEVEWAKFKRGEEINEQASKLREQRIRYQEKVKNLVKRMTGIFLEDEKKRAMCVKLAAIEHLLTKSRKKDLRACYALGYL